MDYKKIRNDIQTGDTIAIPTQGFGDIFGFVVKTAQMFTKRRPIPEDNIKHVGVAYWVGKRLWLAEMDGVKNVMSPLSQHDNFIVYECPIDVKLFEKNVWHFLETKINYNYFQLAHIVLAELFNRRRAGIIGVVCSTFVVRIYKRDNSWGNDLSASISPSTLCSKLTKRFEVK